MNQIRFANRITSSSHFSTIRDPTNDDIRILRFVGFIDFLGANVSLKTIYYNDIRIKTMNIPIVTHMNSGGLKINL